MGAFTEDGQNLKNQYSQNDELGNRIKESRGAGGRLTKNFYYDCHNQLVEVRQSPRVGSGESTTYFSYDPLGRRIQKRHLVHEVPASLGRAKVAATEYAIEYYWSGDVLLQEQKRILQSAKLEACEQSKIIYVYEPSSHRPAVQIRENAQGELEDVYYYQLDHLGTVQELVNSQGEVVWTGTYKGWGRAVVGGSMQIKSHIRYQGQYFDEEIGLHYNRFRYYDPQIGHYINHDPIGLEGGTNSTQYAPNTTQWIDPLGLQGSCGDAPNKGASIPANGHRLKEHLRQQEKYGTPTELADGRIRYKGDITPASKPGEMVGMRKVREWDPSTGKKRTWMETVDHNGKIRQVRPDEKFTGGKKKHYRFDKDGNYTGSW